MKLKFELGDLKVELYHEPMLESRFRAILALLVVAIYLIAVIALIAKCGIYGVAGAFAATLIVGGVLMGVFDF